MCFREKCLNRRDWKLAEIEESDHRLAGSDRKSWGSSNEAGRQQRVAAGGGAARKEEQCKLWAQLKSLWLCTREIRPGWLITCGHTVGRYRCENIIQPAEILLNPTKLWSPGLIRYSTLADAARSFRLPATCKSFRRYVTRTSWETGKPLETAIYEIWIFSGNRQI